MASHLQARHLGAPGSERVPEHGRERGFACGCENFFLGVHSGNQLKGYVEGRRGVLGSRVGRELEEFRDGLVVVDLSIFLCSLEARGL